MAAERLHAGGCVESCSATARRSAYRPARRAVAGGLFDPARRARAPRSRSRLACVRGGTVRSLRASTWRLDRAASQLSSRCAAARESSPAATRIVALSHARREALVVHLHRHPLPQAQLPARCANSRVSRVCSLSPPRSESGSPTTTRSTSRSRTSSLELRQPAPARRPRHASIGVTIVPVGSLSAQPQRALP